MGQIDKTIQKINSGEISKEKNFGPLNNFFENKTILMNNKFLVSFDDEVGIDIVGKAKKELYESIGYMPTLQYHHIKGVTIPTNQTFQSETIFMSNFVTLSDYQVPGDLTVTLEEDQYGTVAKFINWLQRKLVTKSGVVRPKYLYTLSHLNIDVTNLQDRVVAKYIFDDIYFLNSDVLTLSYDGGAPLQYTISFNFGDNYYIPMAGENGAIFNTSTPPTLESELKNQLQ